MNFKLFSLLIIGSLALICIAGASASPQGGESYGRGNQGGGGGGEDRDLASTLGVDREALYEEMLRMQEEMGSADGQGPPPEIPEGPEGPEGAGGQEGPEGQRDEGGEGQGESQGDQGGYGQDGQGQGSEGGQEGQGGPEGGPEAIQQEQGYGGLSEY